jgi:2-methylcitrate dehydratase PrpD
MSDDLYATQLAKFITRTRYLDLSQAVSHKALVHTLDTFGAALAGSTSNEAKLARTTFCAAQETGASLCWGTSQRLSARSAALVNGIAAHAFELDDTGGCDHSGAVVLPALMALIPTLERPVTGKELLTAITVGYDVGRRVLESFGGYRPHNEAGWHSTGTCGVFGAAAAAANLLQLTTEQTISCLGLAGSFSSGLWGFVHDGTMAKKVHAGRAAEGGVLAALLARGGMTGPRKVFEDVWGGFFNTYGREAIDRHALVQALGQDWRIMNCAIKPYASCRDTHAAIDAIDRLVRAHQITPQEVKEIHIRLNTFLSGMVGGRDVSTLPAAQMSLPYAVSARLCLGQASLQSYSDENRQSEQLRAMIDRVIIDIDDSVQASFSSDVSIVTTDHRILKESTSVALGAPTNPLTQDALIEKFMVLARYALSDEQSLRLAVTLQNLDTLEDSADMLRLLEPTEY